MRYAALPLLAAANGAGAQGLGLLLGFATLPFLVLGLLGGVAADRLDRKRLLIGCDVLRVLISLGLTASVLAGHVPMVTLYAVAFLMGLLESVATSASFAYLPSLAEGDTLVSANAFSSSALMFGRQLIGPLMGAALIAVTPWLPFLLDGASFLVSGLLITTTAPHTSAVGGPTLSRVAGLRGLLNDVRESATWMRATSGVLLIACSASVVNLFNMGALAIQAHYAMHVLHGAGWVYGLMMAAGALGGVAGAPLASKITRQRPLGLAAGAGLALVGVGYLGVALGFAASALAGLVVTGAGFALWNISTVTWRQRATPDHLLGRADALHRVISWGVLPLGSVLGGFLAARAGDRLPFLLAGVAPLLLSVLFVRRAEPLRQPAALELESTATS